MGLQWEEKTMHFCEYDTVFAVIIPCEGYFAWYVIDDTNGDLSASGSDDGFEAAVENSEREIQIVLGDIK
jgi:hypothetical protein